MKITRTLLFICIFCSYASIFAQNNVFTFGVKLGGNIGAPVPFGNIPKGATGAPLVGLNLGSWVRYYLNTKLSLNLEFSYSIKGASFKTPLVNQYYEDVQYLPKADGTFEKVTVVTTFNGKAEGKFDNNYLEWPILLSYKPGKKVCLIGGLYFAYMFSTATYATGEGTVGYSPTIVTRTIPFEEELNKFDFGPLLGAKYENGGHFSFDGRMAYGIPSIFKESYKTINYSINNFYFQFAVYYRFGKEIGNE